MLVRKLTESGQRRLAMDVNSNERIMDTLIAMINDLMWGAVLIYLLIGVGIFFTFRLGFIQIRHFGHMFSVLRNSRKSDSAGISSFQALCTSLAARVGTGNLAGVAVAIYLGGPGAVFWMWAIAFLGAGSAYIESALSQVWKEQVHGEYRGGPAYYIEKGLKSRPLGIAFAILTVFGCGLALPGIQSKYLDCLEAANIKTVSDVMLTRTERLAMVKGLGQKTAHNVFTAAKHMVELWEKERADIQEAA